MSLGPNYRKLFAATTVSNLGDGVSSIAAPWLASALTRNPVLIALVAVAERLPWLVFTLPAGVITDRNDRRKLMVVANGVRCALTFVIAAAVALSAGALPSPDDVDSVTGTKTGLFVLVVTFTLLIGVGEVIYDNSAQTFLPEIVASKDLETANGRTYSAEVVANQLAGPPLASLLLAVGFAVPFVFDAATFGVSAILIFVITVTAARTVPVGGQPGARCEPVAAQADEAGAALTTATPAVPGGSWRSDIAEGWRWLMSHEVLRPMALVLGGMNMLSSVAMAGYVLFAQEVLHTSTLEFAVLSLAGAIGGVAGGWWAAAISRRLGSGPTLWITVGAGVVIFPLSGLMSSWPPVFVLMALYMFSAVMWNVITVSFRQSIIPPGLLGRVNSVYRFFAWGAIPIGALIGGAIIAAVDAVGSRTLALRMPFLVTGAASALLLIMAVRRLTTERLDEARVKAPARTPV